MDPVFETAAKIQGPSELLPPEQLMNAMPPDQVQQQQAERFAAMMNADQTNASQMVAPDKVTQNPSVISKIVEGQDALLNNAMNELDNFKNQQLNSQATAFSEQMSLPQMMSQIAFESTQMTVQSMQVSQDVAMTAMNLQAKMGLVDSLKQSANTLLRNQ